MSLNFPARGEIGGTILKGVLVVAAGLMLGVAARGYYSEYLLVLAEGGRKTVKDYDKLLNASINANPWNGPAYLRKADLLLSQGRYEQALKVLSASSPGKNHWHGWERLGAIRERIAFAPVGTENDIEAAAASYDRVLAVYPTYERGIERRAVLALRSGEWNKVEQLTGQLQELDFNNMNVTYMRARTAEAIGDTRMAAHLYMQLSARTDSSTSSLFTREDVDKRLRSLGRLDK